MAKPADRFLDPQAEDFEARSILTTVIFDLEVVFVGKASGAFAPQWRMTSIGIAVAISLFAFEAMAVATAMPVAVRDLHGLAFYSWPFSAFLVTTMVGLVMAGQWGDRVGAQASLLTGIAVFGAGLLIAGIAPWMWIFVVGRGLQGFGVGLATVGVFLIVATGYPEEVQPKALAVISAGYVLPALVGPVISGSLTTYVSWRWVFLGLVPLIMVGGALLMPVLRRLPAPEGIPFKDPGRPLFAFAAGLGVLALQYGGNSAVAGMNVLSTLLIAVGLAALVLGLHRLLPNGVWQLRRGLPAVVGLRGLLAGSFYAMESTVPLVLVTVHRYSSVAAGLPLLVGALGWWSGAQLQGRLNTTSRYDLIRWGFISLAGCVAGLVPLCFPGAPGWPTYVLWTFGGLGMGLAVPSTGVLILKLSPENAQGANSSALQISDVTSAAVCISLGGVLISAAERGAFSLSTAISILGIVMAVLALTGALMSSASRSASLVTR